MYKNTCHGEEKNPSAFTQKNILYKLSFLQGSSEILKFVKMLPKQEFLPNFVSDFHSINTTEIKQKRERECIEC